MSISHRFVTVGTLAGCGFCEDDLPAPEALVWSLGVQFGIDIFHNEFTSASIQTGTL